MKCFRRAACLLILTLLNVIKCAHEPAPGSPSFIRSSVESVPQDNSRRAGALTSIAYGETALPLRTAVESIPSIPESSGQSFIRSSIEHRPIEGSSRYERRLEPAASSVNPSYLVPKTFDHGEPQPFRADSPFQQLLDNRYVHGTLLAKYRGTVQTYDAADSTAKKILCYITNWSYYRYGEGKFVPEQLDAKLCTHIIYSFGSLDPGSLTVREFDKWSDLDNDLYRRTTAFKVPVLLAIGGWTDSTGDKYSRLVSSSSARHQFIATLIPYLQKYGFSGVNFEWNYPKCWQSDCRKGPETDRINFTKLIRELSVELRKHGYLLGVGISGYKEIITQAYEVDQLSNLADFLTVMTYDYHGAWEKRTGHVSPLYSKSDDKYPQYNTDYTLQLLKREGADPKKIIVGVPFYGQSFTLEESLAKLVGTNIPARGPGKPGEFTKQPGMLAYYEICDRIRTKGWRKGRESSQKSGPFAQLNDQWVGFDDAEAMETKAKYVIEHGFGGVAAWTVDLDDFTNRCCVEAFPLLRAINRAFGRIDTIKPAPGNCRPPPEPVTPVAPQTTTVGETGIPGSGHDSTTWPSWNPSSTPPTTWNPSVTASTQFTWWPTPTTTTTKKPATTTTTKATTTTTTTEESVIIEAAEVIPIPVNTSPVYAEGKVCSREGEYFRHDQCSKYYHCVHGMYQEHDCAGGLHWNERVKLCDWPASAKCAEHKSPKPQKPESTPQNDYPIIAETSTHHRIPITTTPKVTPTTVRTTPRPHADKPNRKPTDSCQNGEYRSNIDDCQSYFVCVNHEWTPHFCADGFQYDQTSNECDVASKVRCLPASRYLQYIGKLGQFKLDDPCDGKDFAPYPGKCSDYLLCLHGTLQAGSCAEGLYWNPKTNNCDWPENVKCNDEAGTSLEEGSNEIDRPRPTKPVPTTTTTRKPRPVTPQPPVKRNSGYYKMVCYFTNWAWYRKGIAKYTPDDIDTRLCTHIVYGFAVLDYSELTIRTHDSWADIDNRFYERVVELQRKGVNVSLALGGWNDSQGDKYSRLVRSPGSRRKFVDHTVQFLEKYGFGGLDLDWEYPVCWQTECNKGFKDEKEGFTDLVRELSQAFKARGLLLSTAVSPSKEIIDKGYEVEELARYFDWIAVMTYDYHGQWDKKTGHVAPLYQHPEDDVPHFNGNFSINYWIEKGAPSRKIAMGVPLYGQAFELSDTKNNGLNARAPGPGKAGEHTRSAGFLAYYEICDRIYNRDWTVVQDPKHRMGPYAYHGNQWVSFDDKEMIHRKAEFIRKHNLFGGMVWALDLDDFKNSCGDGHHPLLTELHNVLSDPPSQTDNQPAVVETPLETPLETPVETSVETSVGISQTDDSEIIEDVSNVNTGVESVSGGDTSSAGVPVAPSDDTEYKVVCYFTNWAWYRQGGGKYLPEDIDSRLCTHIVYGFAVLDGTSLTIKPHDTWADFDNKFYERVVAHKKKGVKVTVAIGGWNDSAGDKYSRLVRDAAARARFVRHVIEFIDKHGFDGLDLDWEYPVCWQVECTKGHADEKEHFAELVRELSEAFRPRGWLLSSAVSPSKVVIDAGYDVPTLSKYFSWIAVMAYDYHGQWDKQTGHVAPMYVHPLDTNPFYNTNFTINYWIEKGADPKKLILGMPMYGQSFSLAESKRNTLNSPTYGGGEAGEATRARGFLAYYEICERIQKQGWHVVRDKKGRMGPYAYNKDQWVSFDDALMIRHKSEFVKSMKLGGAMIWALDLDDFKNYCNCEEYPLLRTINRVLRNYPGPHPKCPLEARPEVVEDVPHDENEVIVVESSEAPTKPSTTPSTTRKPVEPTEVLEVPSSEPCSGHFQAHPDDCNSYRVCEHGQWLNRQCAAGLHWNAGSNHCDWPANARCTSETSGAPADPNQPATSPRPTTTTTRKPRPPKPTTEITTETDDGKFKVVCYFTNWAWYRPGEGKFLPEDIDENLCTHVVYGFAVLDGTTLTIKSHDSWADKDNNFYSRVTALRKKGIRVVIGIGGWNDSLGDKYSRLVLDANARYNFITNVIEFIEENNFEGLDLDWEYPVCWQVECYKGKPSEKQGFVDLVKELSDEFKPRGWLLSAAVSPSKMVIDLAYDIPQLSRYLDFISVMTYDYHGQWDRKTGHVAPLHYYPGDTWDYFNANFTINYWIQQGASSRKIIMGVPLYGQSFTLGSAQNNGLNAPSYAGGEAGKYTRANGFLSFYEICDKTKRNGWTVVRDPQNRIGPYAYQGNQWVSYDDVENINKKANFMRSLNLGGGMIWALDLDDFRGSCGCGSYPLLTTLNHVLRNKGSRTRGNCS